MIIDNLTFRTTLSQLNNRHLDRQPLVVATVQRFTAQALNIITLEPNGVFLYTESKMLLTEYPQSPMPNAY